VLNVSHPNRSALFFFVPSNSVCMSSINAASSMSNFFFFFFYYQVLPLPGFLFFSLLFTSNLRGHLSFLSAPPTYCRILKSFLIFLLFPLSSSPLDTRMPLQLSFSPLFKSLVLCEPTFFPCFHFDIFDPLLTLSDL